MNEVENHSVRKEEEGTLPEHCRLKDMRKGLQWTRSTSKHSGRNEMKDLIDEKNLSKGHNTPVIWISKKNEHDPDKTRRWVEESNITMPPEGRNRK